MKKIIAILICLLFVASFASCKSEKTSSGYLLKEGVLKVAVEPEYPPMEYKDNGKLVGFDVELAEAVAKEMGVEIEFVETGWDGIFMGLSAGHYDVICSSVSITQLRIDEKEMSFSKPYMNNGQYIIVPKGSTGINTLEDLQGKRVGVQMVTTADEACKKYLNEKGKDFFEHTSFDTIQLALMGLEAGHLDVVVADAAVAIAFVNNNPEKFSISQAKMTNEPIAFATAYENNELIEKLNEAIDALAADGTLSNLSIKYMQTDMTSNIDTELR